MKELRLSVPQLLTLPSSVKTEVRVVEFIPHLSFHIYF